MSFLFPLGLLGLASVPVLVWLWRLASSKKQTKVASLIPFEHLARRTSTHRRRVVINWLFWLQLLALLIAALALAQPVIPVAPGKTILAILDTSASMSAVQGTSSLFEQAKQSLSQRLAGKNPADSVLVMITAPTAPLTPEPVTDGLMLAQAVGSQKLQHLGGQLSTAQRLGVALLGKTPDAVWVFTDEIKPRDISGPVEWIAVGQPFANVAITSVDALGPLCQLAEPRVAVTLQNFSDKASTVAVIARQSGRELASATTNIPPLGRQTATLPLQPKVSGLVELRINPSGDALTIDNQAWVVIEPQARLPIITQVSDSALSNALSHWLGACPSLNWKAAPAQGAEPYLLITDQPQAHSGPSLIVGASSNPAVASHWVVTAEHAIASYLAPVDVVAAPIEQKDSAISGIPVVSALMNGKRLPVVIADEQPGRRSVHLLFDITNQEQSTPVALLFFNSLRWLMGDSRTATTRDVLAVSGWDPGQVTIRYPDGSSQQLNVEQSGVRDEAAVLSGVYQLTQGRRLVWRVMNFFDPLESNTFERVSTWAPLRQDGGPFASGTRSAPQSKYPLSSTLIIVLLAVFILEWVVFSLKRGRTSPKPS